MPPVPAVTSIISPSIWIKIARTAGPAAFNVNVVSVAGSPLASENVVGLFIHPNRTAYNVPAAMVCVFVKSVNPISAAQPFPAPPDSARTSARRNSAPYSPPPPICHRVTGFNS